MGIASTTVVQDLSRITLRVRILAMATDNEIEDMFSRPDNPISLSPLQKTEAGTTQSRNCGGTANILPEERAKCSFEIDSMMAELDGGVEKTAKR